MTQSGLRGAIDGVPWKKGVSGNPGGRPKGLARLVRELTNDGAQLVNLQMRIMTGRLKVKRRNKDGVEFEQVPSIQDRQKALEWLADRGFGKSVETHTLQNPDGTNIRQTLILALAQAVARGDVTVRDITPLDESKRAISNPGAFEALPDDTVNANGIE